MCTSQRIVNMINAYAYDIFLALKLVLNCTSFEEHEHELKCESQKNKCTDEKPIPAKIN